MAYLLDANIFIQAQNLHYGFDFHPGFWDWLEKQHESGGLLSIKEVGNELTAFGDELSGWALARPDSFFAAPNEAVLAAAQEVSMWVTHQQYEPAAISHFLGVADFWLVAKALAEKHTIVTHEIASASVRKIKIPNVCLGVNVEYTAPHVMLRREHARFVCERN